MNFDNIAKDLMREQGPPQEERAKAVVDARPAHQPTTDRREQSQHVVVDAKAPKQLHHAAQPNRAYTGDARDFGIADETRLLETEERRQQEAATGAQIHDLRQALEIEKRLCPAPIELVVRLENDMRRAPNDPERVSIWLADRTATLPNNAAGEMILALAKSVQVITALAAKHSPALGAELDDVFALLTRVSIENREPLRAAVYAPIRDAARGALQTEETANVE